MDVVLEELKIHRFRNVLPRTALKLGSPFTVLLGRNATGKTTLLSLISAVLRGHYPFPSENIHLEYKFKTPHGTVEGEVLSEPLVELRPLHVGTTFRTIGLPRGYQQYENIKMTDPQGNFLLLTYIPSLGQYELQSSLFPETRSIKVTGGSRNHVYQGLYGENQEKIEAIHGFSSLPQKLPEIIVSQSQSIPRTIRATTKRKRSVIGRGFGGYRGSNDEVDCLGALL